MGYINLPFPQVCDLSACYSFGMQVLSPFMVDHAIYARDALAKAIYGQTFTWLVNKINESMENKVGWGGREACRFNRMLRICMYLRYAFFRTPQERLSLGFWTYMVLRFSMWTGRKIFIFSSVTHAIKKLFSKQLKCPVLACHTILFYILNCIKINLPQM